MTWNATCGMRHLPPQFSAVCLIRCSRKHLKKDGISGLAGENAAAALAPATRDVAGAQRRIHALRGMPRVAGLGQQPGVQRRRPIQLRTRSGNACPLPLEG